MGDSKAENISRTLVPFPEFEKQCPVNARWAWFNRKENGLEKSGAVIRYGRRLLVNPSRFFEWLEEQGAEDAVNKKNPGPNTLEKQNLPLIQSDLAKRNGA